MLYRLSLSMLIFMSVAFTGCRTAPSEAAPLGAAPALGTPPVGPVPGVSQQPAKPQNPYTQDRMAVVDGRQLFMHYNCYGCHGGHAGGGMGPSLRDATWIYGSSDSEIFQSISQGRARGMPAWGTRLPQEEIWKLVAYIKSLRTPLEPDAPPKVVGVTPKQKEIMQK